jgi:hypothetical protein
MCYDALRHGVVCERVLTAMLACAFEAFAMWSPQASAQRTEMGQTLAK